MTLNHSATETYERSCAEVLPSAVPSETNRESIFGSRLPKLFWAGVSIFGANVLVLGGVLLSPNMQVGLYGVEAAGFGNSSDRPSAFTEVVDLKPVQKAKTAEKLIPVAFEQQPTTEASLPTGDPGSPADSSLAIPRVTLSAAGQRTANTLSGTDVYRAVEGISSFRRVTAAQSIAAVNGTAVN